MRKIILLLTIVITGCLTTTKIVQQSPSEVPVIPTDTTVIIKKDTILIRDTINRYFLNNIMYPVLTSNYLDTDKVYLSPSSTGDNWSQIQASINNQKKIYLSKGNFPISQPLIVAVYDSVKHDYDQSWCFIQGIAPAKGANGNYITQITPTYTNAMTIGIQQGKDCHIENIQFNGKYKPPATQGQIDTLSYAQWADGKCRTTPTSPYAAIVIDPFSDPKYLNYDPSLMYPGLVDYYFSWTSQSGTTGTEIINCNIQGYVVGILVTAVNQVNGEDNEAIDVQVGNCMSAFASTQAQAKTNQVIRGRVWGGVHDIVDGVHYGIMHTDASTPWRIYGMNIAGINYQLIDIDNRSFPGFFKEIYSEGLHKIGLTGSQTSTGSMEHFTDCEFNFEDNGRNPGWWYHGAGTTFSSCIFRYYGLPYRIVINDAGDNIEFGNMSAVPLMIFGQSNAYNTIIYGTSFLNGQKAYYLDSASGGQYRTIRVNGVNGYFLTTIDTANLTKGMLFYTAKAEAIDSLSLYHPQTAPINYQYAIGYFDHRSGDTIFVNSIAEAIHDMDILPVYIARFKK